MHPIDDNNHKQENEETEMEDFSNKKPENGYLGDDEDDENNENNENNEDVKIDTKNDKNDEEEGDIERKNEKEKRIIFEFPEDDEDDEIMYETSE